MRRSSEHRPETAAELTSGLASRQWKQIPWRQGNKLKLFSRFAYLRVRPAHRDYWRSEPWPEQWLLIELPEGELAPTKFRLVTVSAKMKLPELVSLAKQRWIIEREYEELSQQLGLGHFEGRGWRGFHHHATLWIAAYGFLIAERSRFSPSVRVGQLQLALPEILKGWKPRGASGAA